MPIVNPGSGGGSSSSVTATVTGNVAAGATDSGNPVKTGGVYLATQPTLTNGLRGNTQLSARGETLVAPGTSGFAVTQTINSAPVAGLKNVTTAGTAEAIGNTTTLLMGITIKARSTNTSSIFVGPSTVTSVAGYSLLPGQAVWQPGSQLANIYLNSLVSGEGATFTGG